ncbi:MULTISPECIES: phosphonate C-P lyase system protein PhnH [Cobetia]|uniref:phosphonate C-P lyase system protein PhnH n=1 Tax=Cobetia TaxID=204286 RepID=UPI0004AF075B|nr:MULTISPECIES: phosphonate C-P lyase system protein PhnH [Cobetia]
MPHAAQHDVATRELRPHDWPALDDAVHHSQRLFRQLLSAMSEPGTVHDIPVSSMPQGVALSSAAWGTLLALCDLESRLWIADELNRDGLAAAISFHTGARIVTCADEADFALVTPHSCQRMPNVSEGSDTYPDRSTTLIVVLAATGTLKSAEGFPHAPAHGPLPTRDWRLSGPGIRDSRVVALDVKAEALMQRLACNRAHFPLGLDAILTADTHLIAIPRSTQIDVVTATEEHA